MIELVLKEANAKVSKINKSLVEFINIHAKLASLPYTGSVSFSYSSVHINIKGCPTLDYSCGVAGEIEELLDVEFEEPSVSEYGTASYYTKTAAGGIFLSNNFDPGTCKVVKTGKMRYYDPEPETIVVCG